MELRKLQAKLITEQEKQRVQNAKKISEDQLENIIVHINNLVYNNPKNNWTEVSKYILDNPHSKIRSILESEGYTITDEGGCYRIWW